MAFDAPKKIWIRPNDLERYENPDLQGGTPYHHNDTVRALVEAARGGLIAAKSDLEYEIFSCENQLVPSRMIGAMSNVRAAQARVDALTAALAAFPDTQVGE